MKKLELFGTPYTYKEVPQYSKELEGNAGICNFDKKVIYVIKDYDNLRDKERIKLHEIIHGMFWEAGLRAYAEDETLVEWLAQSLGKILSVYEKVRCK